MRRYSQTGFTIVEIMIVVMILGVLAALVLPNMRSSALRAKVSEVILALGTCKNQVSELYQSGGDPPGAGNWGCEASNVSRYVDTITTDDIGVITVSVRGTGDLRVDFHDITLAPLDNTGTLPTGGGSSVRQWRCGRAGDGTSVPPQYLPNSCRG
jgi:type IV pilus assembly protein PilA